MNAWEWLVLQFNSIFNRCIDRGFNCGTKNRSDKGESIFVSESRQTQIFVALNEYEKQRGQDFRDSPDKMCEKMLREDCNRLNSHDKRYYELAALNKLERSRHLKDELTDLLKKTKWKIRYEEMARQLGDIVSDEAIRKYLQSLKGFSIRKDRILPHLSMTAKFRRTKWAEICWLFLCQLQKLDLYLSTWMRNGFMLSTAEPIVKLSLQLE